MYKLVVFVPKAHLEKLRIAICDAGAGKIGNYSDCTFYSEGIGTFKPLKGANPYTGNINKLKKTKEVRLETVVPSDKLKQVLSAMKKNHPYEVVAFDVIKLEDYKQWK